MVRLILCLLGVHQPVLTKTDHYEGSSETYYTHWCARPRCTWHMS